MNFKHTLWAWAICLSLAPTRSSQAQLARPQFNPADHIVGTVAPTPGTLTGGTVLGGPPPNNLCSEATVVALSNGSVEVRNGDNTGATDELGFGVGQAWEAFSTTTCLDVTISFCGTDPAFLGIFDILTLGCPFQNLAVTRPELVDQSTCGDGNFTIRFQDLPPGTYYYPILTAPGATGPYTLTFSATACTSTPPVNDVCSGAIVLSPSSTCNPVTGDVTGAANGSSLPAITCAGFTGDAGDDVWYSFTATAETHTIIVQGSAQFDATVDLRTGDCDAPTTIACADASGQGGQEVLNATGLTVGQVYYVRVNDWFGGVPTTTTFTICVLGPDPGICAANAGTLSPASTTTCLDGGTASLSATPAGNAVVPSGYTVLYVLTEGNDLVIQGTSTTPAFEVTVQGTYRIHTLVYDPTTLDLSIVELGVTTGGDVAALLEQGGGSICGSLDVTGAAFNVLEDCSSICPADAGTLSGVNGNVCIENGLGILLANHIIEPTVPDGYQVLYVLTSGPGLVIVNAEVAPFFGVNTPGTYTIHTLVYDPNTLDLSAVQVGVTTGFDVNALLIQGGGSICASLDVAGAAFTVENCTEPCTADAGTLSGGGQVCLEDGSATLTATPGGNTVVPDGYEVGYVLTEGPGLVIVGGGGEPIFSVDAEGTYTIHTLVYDPNTLDLSIVVPGETTGFDVNALLIQGGGSICASLDVAGAAFTVENCTEPCTADAGTLSGGGQVCLEDGSATLTASPDGNTVVPAGYEVVYGLSQGAGLVLIEAGADPEFTVTEEGTYTIHTLVYDPNTLDIGLVELGVTTGFDVNALLVQGGGSICASLDVAGAAFTVENCTEPCTADAGTLSGGGQACLEEGSATLTATPDGNSVVPAGFAVAYVLTEGPGLVIVGAGAAPEFSVDAEGTYTIHTLVYDPNTLDLSIVVPGETTGFDVNALLVQGGGSICASLDVAGAAFTVETCTVQCDAFAGTLTADEVEVCLVDGVATLSVTPNGDAVIPDGFFQVFAVTQGPALTIIDGDDVPSFEVTAEGAYTVHSFVLDPSTFDLNSVIFGETTAAEVLAQLVQGGGTLCGNLDVTGVTITVVSCTEPCLADAGTLSGGGTVCLEDGSADLVATPDGNSVVPDGYQVAYVLTEGPGLVIAGAGGEPIFNVDAEGTYTIHTLVYDPTTLDLGIVVPGETTGFDVNALLIQGGGSICASLDVAGAAFTVETCVPPCTANAGTLTAEAAEYCLQNGLVVVSATPDGNAVVPAGFNTAYALTQGPGLVIITLANDPVFTISQPGSYTIHTLVFDPATVDPGAVVIGETTGFDINALLIQGGGTICGALDVAGAPITVLDCTPANNACNNAAEIPVGALGNCVPVAGDNTYAGAEGAAPGCDNTNVGFADVWYRFNAGSNTEVVIAIDPITMTDWGLTIAAACGGQELYCEVQPTEAVVFSTTPGQEYVVRIFSNLQFGDPGTFELCLTGAEPTVQCDGGLVATTGGNTLENICQDGLADVLAFTTTSASTESYTFIVTNDQGAIVTPLAGNALDFNGAALGSYRVYGIAHNGALQNATPGVNIANVTAAGQCFDLSNNFVTVNVELCTALDEAAELAFRMFPNPGNGNVTLVPSFTTERAALQVYDMGGRLVHEEVRPLRRGEDHLLLLAGRLVPGSYLLRATAPQGTATARLIVQ